MHRLIRTQSRAITLLALVLAACSGGGGGDSAKAPTAPAPGVPVLTTVTVSLSAATIQVGQTASASATGLDQNGSAIAIGTVTWATGSPSIATVSAAGVVSGVAAGQVSITATASGRTGQASLTVIPVPVATVSVSPVTVTLAVGATQQLTAAMLDGGGIALTGRVVAWTTSDSTKARVSTSGLVSAVAAGSATITATSEGKSGTSVVTVTLPPVATVTVSPSSGTVGVGATQTFTATLKDAAGNTLTGRAVTWSTSNASVANVSSTGVVTGVAAGTATVTATSEGKSGSTAVTVVFVPVASVTVAPATATVTVGGTVVLTATAVDANGNVLTGRTFSWTSSNLSVVSGTFLGNVLTASGVGVGSATLSATSEGKSGASVVTVTSSAQACTSATALQLSVGQVVSLTTAQKASLCLGGIAASEYVLIPFNNSTVAASTVSLQVTGTNTSTIITPPLTSRSSGSPGAKSQRAISSTPSAEGAFRERERRDLSPMVSRIRQVSAPARLTAVPAIPVVGSTVQLNANLGGSTCLSPKQLHAATVVAVLPHTIVLSDNTSPSGGYTSAEMTAFGTAFDTLGYGVDTLNFGAPTDIDGNGRVAVFFTPGVNLIPAPAGSIFLGLQASRDLYSVTTCLASNEGEIFYMPVPDPNQTINGNYTSKTFLASGVIGTLVHEFQHMINSGRRIYVNNAASIVEDVWLNEGLSHIAEELLYYRVSGNSPRTNINATVLGSSQAQANAYNSYLSNGDFQKLGVYLAATETNSPYSQVDILETRGAAWQLLRYASDRKGSSERGTWFALVNATTTGQTNFSNVFGDITSITRDWVVAQWADDAGLGVAATYTHPSWNFRSIFPGDSNFGVWPLGVATWSLPSGTQRTIVLNGGGAAYIRFRVAAGVFATTASTSSGQPLPSSVDFILVRTQ